MRLSEQITYKGFNVVTQERAGRAVATIFDGLRSVHEIGDCETFEMARDLAKEHIDKELSPKMTLVVLQQQSGEKKENIFDRMKQTLDEEAEKVIGPNPHITGKPNPHWPTIDDVAREMANDLFSSSSPEEFRREWLGDFRQQVPALIDREDLLLEVRWLESIGFTDTEIAARLVHIATIMRLNGGHKAMRLNGGHKMFKSVAQNLNETAKKDRFVDAKSPLVNVLQILLREVLNDNQTATKEREVPDNQEEQSAQSDEP